MKVKKSTHDAYNVEMFAPIMKEADKYIAVLSDTSIDRDGERVGKSALNKIAQRPGYLAALMDHENKVLNQVACWKNVQVKEIDGHVALTAEPHFFKSNDNARQIKGMLDEGAELGISIGAIVREYEDVKIKNKSVRTFTDLELLEASFVAIPSNKHGRAVAVAKSFKMEAKMTDTFTQKDIDSAVKKKVKEISELSKQLESVNKKIKDLEKQLEDADSKVEEAEKAKSEAESETEKAKKELKEVKDKALEKQKFTDQGNNSSKKELSESDIEKAFSEGKLPIGNFQR